MTDIDRRLEQRLRDDAARPDPVTPPSLDDALDAALGRRPPAVGWLAAAAAVIVLTGAAVLVALRPGGDDRSAPAAPVPSISGVPLHRDGKTLQRVTDAGVDTVFLVPGNPRRLEALVPYSTSAGGCSLFRPTVTVVAQTATQIRLRASGYEYLGRPNKNGYVGFSCNLDKTRPVTVRLDDPLGSRTVYGNAAGDAKARIVDPSDVPVVTYLPPGYRLVDQVLPDADTGETTASRIYRKGDAELDIDSADTALDQPIPISPVTGHADVRGHRATVTGDGEQRCVSWQESRHRPRSVCSLASVVLSPAALLEVARGLT